MQNYTQDPQCKKVDLNFCLQKKKVYVPLTSLVHDGVLLLGLADKMVKKEFDVDSLVKDGEVLQEHMYEGSSPIPIVTVVVGDIKKERDKNFAEKFLTNQFTFRDGEESAAVDENKFSPRGTLKMDSAPESENKQISTDLISKPMTVKTKESLKEKYRKINKKQGVKMLKRRSLLNTGSLMNPRKHLQRKLNLKKKSPHLNKASSNSPIKSESEHLVSCRFCKKSFTSLEKCRNHSCKRSKCVSNQTVHKCELCSMAFKCKNYLDRHIKGHNRNNCKFCSDQFTTRKALCKHLKTVHNIAEPEKVYACSFCGKTFTKRPSLHVHLKTHADGKFLCMRCGFMCIAEVDYVTHLKKHIKDTKYECTLCGKRFVRRQQHDQHMMGHERHFCQSCDVTFSTKKLLLQHQQSLHGVNAVKNHECPICKKKFFRPLHLQIHLRMHTGEKPVKCSQCEKNFTNERSLAKHMKTARHLQNVNNGEKVELEKPFLCSMCGATFFRQQSLQRHVDILHMDGEAFKCDQCDYTTKCKANMKRHSEGHSNIKRYVCEICGASFRALATLKEHHAFVHSERRSFVCDTCSKSFKNKSSLQRHLRIHSEVRPYKCHCDRDYKRLSHLKRHMASAHHMTIKRSFASNCIQVCDIDETVVASSSNEASGTKQNSVVGGDLDLLSISNQNFSPSNFFTNAPGKNTETDLFEIRTSGKEDDYTFVPCRELQDFIDKREVNVPLRNDETSPLISGVESDSQDSVSLGEKNLNLSSNNYFNFGLMASPLNALENVSSNLHLPTSLQDNLSLPSPQNNGIRPRSLPNLNVSVSNIDAFFPYSIRSSDLSTSIPMNSFLLNGELPSTSMEQSNSSKLLFGESSDILFPTTFNSIDDSIIADCPSKPSFNASRAADIWNITRDSGKMAESEISCDRVTSSMSDFSGSLNSNSNSLLACNLVFPNDPLMDCPLDADSFNTDDFVMT